MVDSWTTQLLVPMYHRHIIHAKILFLLGSPNIMQLTLILMVQKATEAAHTRLMITNRVIDDSNNTSSSIPHSRGMLEP